MRALLASELRQRIRGRRWWVVLLLWFLVLAGLVALVRSASLAAFAFQAYRPPVGSAMFGFLALFALALASLVVPSLTAMSINGERDRGTLAVLQATLYRPRQIVAAKFLSAWITAGVFLAATLPLAAWALAEGGVGLVKAGVVYLVLAVLSGVLAAIGLAASALVLRPAMSAVSAYAVVFFMTALLPVIFGLSLAIGARGGAPEVGPRWVVLAGDPFVILADAAPSSPEEEVFDPLGGIREAVRYLRSSGEPFLGAPPRRPSPVWPTGLAIDLALGGGALWVAAARLRVPARRLSPGQRVA